MTYYGYGNAYPQPREQILVQGIGHDDVFNLVLFCFPLKELIVEHLQLGDQLHEGGYFHESAHFQLEHVKKRVEVPVLVGERTHFAPGLELFAFGIVWSP